MTKHKTISLKKFEKALSDRSFEIISFYVCASKIVFAEVKTKLLRHIFLFIPHSYSFLVPPKNSVKIVNISLFDESYSSLSLPFLEKSPNFSKVDFVTVTGRMITHYGEEIIRWSFDNPETEVASESEDIDDMFMDLDSSSSSGEDINEEVLDEDEEEDIEEEEEEDIEEDEEEISSNSKSEESKLESSKPEVKVTPEEIKLAPEEVKASPEVGTNPESKKASSSSSRKSKETSSESEETEKEEIILKETAMQPIVARFARKEVPKPYPTPIPAKIAETDAEIGALYPCYRLSTFLRIDKSTLEETIFQIIEDVKDIELDSRIQRFLEIKELYGKLVTKLEDVLASAQKDDKSFFINFRKLGTILSKTKDPSTEDKVCKVAEEMNMEVIENREKVETALYNFLTIGKLLLEE